MPVSIPVPRPEHVGILDPKLVYTLGAFLTSAGIGRTTVGDAKKNGIELFTLSAGRRKWVLGSDGIEFLKAIAAHAAASKEAN